MIVLGIETAGPRGSVALLRSSGESREVEFKAAGKLGSELAPTLQRLLREEGLGAACPPDLVAVDVGPGSYTGLRIGLAAAKGLAFAWGRPLLGVSAAEALSSEAMGEVGTRRRGTQVLCAFDASRGEVWAALYVTNAEGQLELVQPGQLYQPDLLLSRIASPTLVVGDAAASLGDDARGIVVSPRPAWPTALQVARLARKRFVAGARDEALEMSPTYYRPNEAEAQRRQRSMKDGAPAKAEHTL